MQGPNANNLWEQTRLRLIVQPKQLALPPQRVGHFGPARERRTQSVDLRLRLFDGRIKICSMSSRPAKMAERGSLNR